MKERNRDLGDAYPDDVMGPRDIRRHADCSECDCGGDCGECGAGGSCSGDCGGNCESCGSGGNCGL